MLARIVGLKLRAANDNPMSLNSGFRLNLKDPPWLGLGNKHEGVGAYVCLDRHWERFSIVLTLYFQNLSYNSFHWFRFCTSENGRYKILAPRRYDDVPLRPVGTEQVYLYSGNTRSRAGFPRAGKSDKLFKYLCITKREIWVLDWALLAILPYMWSVSWQEQL